MLSLGGSTYDPTDPVGRLLFNILGMVAELDADLIRMRTREGMAVAKAKGRLKGKQPKLSKIQRKHLLTLHDAGEHTHRLNRRSCSGCPGRRCTASSNGAPSEDRRGADLERQIALQKERHLALRFTIF